MMLWLASVGLVVVGLVALTAALYGLAWVLFLHSDLVMMLLVGAALFGMVIFVVLAVHDHLEDRTQARQDPPTNP